MDYPHVFVILMGMGTVFFGLICLIALTTIMGRILHRNDKPATQNDPAMISPPPAPVAMPEPNRQEIAAAICAAVAEELGTDITGLRVVSLRKV